MAVDFETVGAAALAMATILLPEWLGGKREGHEWLGERKSNGGPGDSWKVNLNTGAWGAFAGDERGGDLISLYAALHHIEQLAALNQVAGIVGVTIAPWRYYRRPKPDTIVEAHPGQRASHSRSLQAWHALGFVSLWHSVFGCPI